MNLCSFELHYRHVREIPTTYGMAVIHKHFSTVYTIVCYSCYPTMFTLEHHFLALTKISILKAALEHFHRVVQT